MFKSYASQLCRMVRAFRIFLVLGCLSGCGAFRLPLNLVVLLLPAHGNLFATTGEGTHFQQRGFILGGPQPFTTTADNCNR